MNEEETSFFWQNEKLNWNWK